jgi:hypothetical protein
MIKSVLFAALVFAAAVCPVLAEDAKVSVDMIGMGGMSCAHWRNALKRRAVARNVDSISVRRKAPAGRFMRLSLTSAPTTTISATGGGVLISPSFDGSRLRHPDRFSLFSGTCFTRQRACNSSARRSLADASINGCRTVAHPLQTVRSTGDDHDNRTVLWAVSAPAA